MDGEIVRADMSAALQTDMDEAVNLVSADEATKNLLFNGTGANGDVTLTATNNTTDITLTLPNATGTLATIADITSGATSALDHGTNSGTSLTFDGTQTNDVALLNTLVTSGNIQLNLTR